MNFKTQVFLWVSLLISSFFCGRMTKSFSITYHVDSVSYVFDSTGYDDLIQTCDSEIEVEIKLRTENDSLKKSIFWYKDSFEDLYKENIGLNKAINTYKHGGNPIKRIFFDSVGLLKPYTKIFIDTIQTDIDPNLYQKEKL